MRFTIIKNDKESSARIGKIILNGKKIKTPVFMPVGTLGNVKGILHKKLKDDSKAEIILNNTYHLYLRPGVKIIREAGGIHTFTKWEHPIITDSGGYQVYSLSSKRKITEKGVDFQSHIDGSHHFFTPEYAIDIQRIIGADIIMAFDECPKFNCGNEYAKKSMELTHRWLDRCLFRFNSTKELYERKQTFFPIVQGGTNKNYRKESAHYISSKKCLGNAIGGLSVGEPDEVMYEMTQTVCSILPLDKPRYLMGVGTPINLLENISLGIDMFDCVLPSRNARNGMLYTSEGVINIKNSKWKNDHSLIDRNGKSEVDQTYSKAFLRHLFNCNEILAKQIATLHNLRFYSWLIEKSREKIKNGDFSIWKKKMIKKLSNKL